MSWPENYVQGENTATVTLNVYESDGTTVVTSGLVSAFSGTDTAELNLVPNNGTGFSDDLADGAAIWCTIQVAMAASATVHFKYKNDSGEVFNLTYLDNSTPTSEKNLFANDTWGGYGAALESPEPIIFTIVPNTTVPALPWPENYVQGENTATVVLNVYQSDGTTFVTSGQVAAFSGTDPNETNLTPSNGVGFSDDLSDGAAIWCTIQVAMAASATVHFKYKNDSGEVFNLTYLDNSTPTSEKNLFANDTWGGYGAALESPEPIIFTIVPNTGGGGGGDTNDPATGKPTITGTPSEGQTLTATLGDMADNDGLSGVYTYQWKRDGSTNIGTDSTTYTVTSDDVGSQITVTVSFTDNGGNNESLTSDPVTVVALDDEIYFWTEYNDASNNTAIYYGIYNTSKISGVILNYDLSLNATTGETTTVTDLSYNEQDQIDNDTMIFKKEWPIHVINTRTDTSETNDTGVANKQMVFAGAMNQSINGMNMGVFAIIRGNITLTSIASLVDNTSNFLTPDKYAIGEPANPPEITEPGGRPLGDINYDASLNDVDIEIMSAYLLNNTDISFNVYDGSIDSVLYTNKTAIEIIGTIDTDGKIVTQGLMSEYDILTYIDVNNNNIIDVGDLVRMLSKRANPNFSITNGV